MKIQTKDKSTLINKIVTFTETAEVYEIDFDAGMKARILSITSTGGGCYACIMDFSEFEEYNKQFMKPNYFNQAGVPCETWEEQIWYAKDLENGAKIHVAFEYDTGCCIELPFELDPGQMVNPTVDELVDTLERVTLALMQRGLGQLPVVDEANEVLTRAGRSSIK